MAPSNLLRAKEIKGSELMMRKIIIFQRDFVYPKTSMRICLSTKSVGFNGSLTCFVKKRVECLVMIWD